MVSIGHHHEEIMTHQAQDRYIVRMPDGMKEKIKEEAARNCRSMNSEIVFHLQQIFDTNRETKKGPVSA